MGPVDLHVVDAWDTEEIVDLYREGGWWQEEWDHQHLSALISGSFRFIVAIDSASGNAVGMGRVISDGASDGYIQDLVVRTEYRGLGIGSDILARLMEECRSAGLGWIGVIAEPGSDRIYRKAGFQEMSGHTPFVWTGAHETER